MVTCNHQLSDEAIVETKKCIKVVAIKRQHLRVLIWAVVSFMINFYVECKLFLLRILSKFAHNVIRDQSKKIFYWATVLPILRYYIQILRWAYINRSKYLFFSEQNFIRILWYARRNLSNRNSEVRNTCTKPWAKLIYNYETIIPRNINNQVSILYESVIMLSLISNKRSFIASFSEHLMQGITDTWH